MRGGRPSGTARAGIAAGPSVRPRTRSWWATSAGCLRRRRFMVRATGKSGRSLRVEGIRTSQERVRRLMRAHDLQAPHRVGQAHGPTAHDGTITTETPDVMWGTDMTATVTVAEGAAFIFVAVDHLHGRVHRSSCRQARDPLRGPGAPPPGCPRTLRRRRRRRRPRAAAAARPRVERPGRRFSTGDRVLQHRQLAELRPGLARVQADVQRNNGCSRNTRTEAPRRCDATSSGGGLRWSRSSAPTREFPSSVRMKRSATPLPSGSRTAGRGRVDANTVKPLSKNPGARGWHPGQRKSRGAWR